LKQVNFSLKRIFIYVKINPRPLRIGIKYLYKAYVKCIYIGGLFFQTLTQIKFKKRDAIKVGIKIKINLMKQFRFKGITQIIIIRITGK